MSSPNCRPPTPLAPRTQAVLISDFLSDPDDISRMVARHGVARRARSSRDDRRSRRRDFSVHGPYRIPRCRFERAAARRRSAIVSRRLHARLAQHRDRIRDIAASRGWSFTVHRTDRPASEALLALRDAARGDGHGGLSRCSACRSPSPHRWSSSALVVLPALYYLLRLTPPRPREVPFPPLRLILDSAGRARKRRRARRGG